MKLASYAGGEWYRSNASGKVLTHAVNGEAIAEISSDGLEFGAVVDYARRVGAPGVAQIHVSSARANVEGSGDLPNSNICLDGPQEIIARDNTFTAQHVYTPIQGVAVHINAFNFPCWGMLEKLTPTLIAGVPAIVKPRARLLT